VGRIHKDLCDRFIIATALAKGIPVVTTDKRFTQYGVTALKGSLKHGRAIGTGALIAIMRGMEKKELDSKETSF
jgi:hypothetical protein